MNTTFGRYRLLERLGQGGMAEVFKAKSYGVEGFEKVVVIKRILPELAQSDEFVEMFIHEAKLAVRLSHAKIVQVFDLGIAPGTTATTATPAITSGEAQTPDAYYMAMEYVNGLDLATLLTRCRRAQVQIPIEMAVYVAAEVTAPGVVDHPFGDRIVLGEPSGEATPRLAALAAALSDAGVEAPTDPDIRTASWVKLWGILAFNPVAALTGSTLAAIAGDEGSRAVVRAMMVEAEAVAGALGIALPIDVDTRIARAAAVGGHRTSMLQDIERGRPMEIDPIVAAVAELGRLTGRPVPTIDLVLGLVRRLARSRGCYAEAGASAPGTRP